MMFRFNKDRVGLLRSRLYDEQSFYPAFIADAKRATCSIIIESPFIGYRRLSWLYPILHAAVKRGVRVTINTRDPVCHEGIMQQQAAQGVAVLQNIGIYVFYTGNHHRKLAIFDRKILYEGSLNILSQADSCEIMRRIESEELVGEMIQFLHIEEYLDIKLAF